MMKVRLLKYNKIITISLLMILIASAYFLFWGKAEIVEAGWWNDSWSYRKALTINSSQVTGDLTNFPVLVSLTDTNLSGHAQEDGDDFIFIDREGKKLSHEIESYASSTGVLVAWVKIPALSSTVDTDIFMYYGNLGVGSQEDTANVWDDNFVMVQHLEEGSGMRFDATQYNNDLSDNNTVTSSSTGKIGTAAEFENSNVEYLERINDDLSDNFPGKVDVDYTISTWVKFESIPTSHTHNIITKGSSVYFMNHNQSDYKFGSYIVSDGPKTDSTVTSTSTWSYVVAVHDGSTVQMYLNGVADGSAGSVGNPADTDEFLLGTRYDKNRTDRSLDGLLDESRVSNMMRSANWIQTEYNNQNNPSLFFAEQDEEVGPGPVGYWSFDEGYGTTAHDESRQGNDGTITGAVWKNEEECVSGKCLYFDGGNSNVNCGSGNNLDNLGPMTYSVWIKPIDVNAFNKGVIMGKSHTSGVSYRGAWFTSTNKLVFKSSLGSGGVYRDSIVNTININNWQYLTITYDGSSNYSGIRIYLNSNEIEYNVGTDQATEDDSAYDFIIGNDAGLFYDYIGYIDEPKVYSYVRSMDQIKQDYNAGLSGIKSNSGVSVSFGGSSDKWLSDGLVGYWKMDETATTSGAIDASGNSNDGTYYGNASTTGGKFGNGGVFGGDNGITTTDQDYFSPAINDMSISFWAKVPTSASARGGGSCGSSGRYFVAKDNSGQADWGFENDSNTRLCFITWQQVGFNHGVVEINRTVNDGLWHHYLGVIDYLNEMKLYIDGELAGVQTNFDETMGNGTQPVQIGRRGDGNPLIGNIDEVRIYNRALSKSEVRKLYEWAPGPVLHLKMDEKSGGTAYDVSGYGNDGTVSGASWGRGKYGSALDFDGDDNYVDIADSETLDITSNITVSAWIKSFGEQAQFTKILNKSKGGGDYYPYQLDYKSSSDNRINFEISDGSNGYTATSTNEIIQDKWTYVVGTYSGSFVRLYIDGKLDDELFASGLIFTNDELVYLGGRGVGYNFNGLIDDVRIYNYARTQKQILEDMNAGGPASKMPVLHLSFDEGRGETVHDSSIHKNNGTAYVGTGGTQTATSSMWEKSGKVNGAIDLDGTDDYVETASITMSNTEEFSFGFWIYSATGNEPTGHFPITWGSNKFCRFYNAYLYCTVDGSPTNAAIIDKDISDSSWHYILFTSNSSSQKIYLDGELNDTSAKTLNTESGVVVIGATTAHSFEFDGLMDEVKIWSYGLNEDEVKEEYNSGGAIMMGGGNANADDNGTTVTGASTEYCIPGDTSECSPPVLELKMDKKSGSTAYDTSGNGNDGTIVGATHSRGKVGAGLEFDGVDDYVDIGNTGKSGYTFEFWVKLNSLTEYIVIFNSNPGAPNINVNNGVISSSGFISPTYYVNGIATSTINTNWCHVVVIEGNGSPAISMSNVNIGRADSNYCDCKIDDFKAFDYARTSAQIAWDYNKGKPIAHWRFDECSGGTIHDDSGNGNHGTLNLGSSGVTATGTCASSSDSFWYNGRSGKKNGSGSFDGAGDYVEKDVQLISAYPFSLSGWVKSDVAGVIVSLADKDVTNVLYAIQIGASGEAEIRIRNTINTVKAGTTNVADETWHHVIGVFNSSTDRKLYVDGIFEASDLISTAYSTAVDRFSIGRVGDSSPGNYIDGQIDDVQIFNYALTAEQVKNVFNDGAVNFK